MSKSSDFEVEQACHTMDLAHRNPAGCLRVMRVERSVLGRVDDRFVPEYRRAELAKLKVNVEQALHALDVDAVDPRNS